MVTDSLARLATLVQERNLIDHEIGALLGRPVHPGHVAEYVASAIFGIDLNPSASAKAHDGRFITGSRAGQTVNVKYAAKRGGNLNLVESADPAAHPDQYLVLTGPRAAATISRGTVAPWVIEAVFLFEPVPLLAALATRGLRPGTATSVRAGFREAAMVFPDAINSILSLTNEQAEALRLFSGNRG